MRKHPRYPVLLDAVVITEGGRHTRAIVTDLSNGGAGIETEHGIEDDLSRFTLVVTEPGFELFVECEARNVRELWRTRVIHAQFIGSHDQADVEDLLYRIRGEKNILPFPVATTGRLTIFRRLFRRRAA